MLVTKRENEAVSQWTVMCMWKYISKHIDRIHQKPKGKPDDRSSDIDPPQGTRQ